LISACIRVSDLTSATGAPFKHLAPPRDGDLPDPGPVPVAGWVELAEHGGGEVLQGGDAGSGLLVGAVVGDDDEGVPVLGGVGQDDLGPESKNAVMGTPSRSARASRSATSKEISPVSRRDM
jgi:hypothetical protein